jgi:hypothetical protein
MSPGSMAIWFDARDLRISGGLMLGAAAMLPVLPFEPGFACPLRSWTGIPCPLCGMTTSVVATVHGDLVSAFAANPAGIVAVAVAAWLLIVRPRSLRVPRPAVVLMLLSMWIFELFRFL